MFGNSYKQSEQSGPWCSGVCPQGFYCPGGTEQPLPCWKGSYCLRGSSVPLRCREGTYGNATNLTSSDGCAICPNGHECGPGSPVPKLCKPGSSAGAQKPLCKWCSAGKFQPSAGQSTCVVCPPGSACPGTGGATAQRCTPGTFAQTDGSTACDRCGLGLYQDASATTTCRQCDPGHWCSSASRVACSENTFNPNPLAHLITNCTRCPERTTTGGSVGLSGPEDCRCLDGFYLAPVDHARVRRAATVAACVEQCCSCPVGTFCNTSSSANTSNLVTLATLPIKRGYYRRVNSTVDIRRCPDAASNCSGRSECGYSTSGCRGGTSAEHICMEGLQGICTPLPYTAL